MSNLFFENQDSEFAYPIEYFDAIMKRPFSLFQAVKEKDSTFFFCVFFELVGEKGACGKGCDAYSPRNGKSGICRNSRPCHQKGSLITFKKKPPKP